jgi:hypothetical protein
MHVPCSSQNKSIQKSTTINALVWKPNNELSYSSQLYVDSVLRYVENFVHCIEIPIPISIRTVVVQGLSTVATLNT